MPTIKDKLPTGTITFLFTDIEGSTQLWEKYPEAMQSALAEHDAILRDTFETRNGHIIKSTGDGVLAVFSTAIEALQATLAAQESFREPLGEVLVRVRMGLHTGEAELRDGDYFGQALNRTARLMSIAHGGQVLVSNSAAELVRELLPANASLRDLGEHRLKDLIRPEHIFQVVHPELQDNFPPLKSLDTFPNNLPIQLTSFVGRERELEEATKRLAAGHLLTMIGPGGTGKTRLALQLAADLLPVFEDGVWFVELAALADPALVWQAIATVFGLREQMGITLPELVTNFVRAKHLLLILDNCEHLVEACAQISDQCLHAGAALKIVASSREALGINGEVVYRVPSLSLPEPGDGTPDALVTFEAVQLFVERAMAAHPAFDLTEKNAASIGQICRRLDGIPLALELAAARVTVFSAEQIAQRLDDRFKLLTGGSRTALPRQQTLRALIDWSYDMLSEQERSLLRCFSVFAGGWSFEAAEAICPDLDVLVLLTQLVNKSLVVVEDDAGETRYHLLETIRQYARDKLLEAGESEQRRDAHLAFFLHFAETVEPKIDTLEALDWITRLEAEYDNFRAALEWGLQQDVAAVLKIVSALMSFWIRRGHEAEGIHWGIEGLTRDEALPIQDGEAGRLKMTTCANTWQACGFLAFSLGDNQHAFEYSARAASLARQLGDSRLLALALSFEISGRLILGEAQGQDELVEEALGAARASGDQYALGVTLAIMGSRMEMVRGNRQNAHDYAEEGIRLLRKSGRRWGYTMAIFGLGMAAKYVGDYTEARTRFAICLPLFQDMGDKHRVSMIKSELAHIERHEGHLQQAGAMYRETIEEWQGLGFRAAVAHQLECFATLASAGGDYPRAARLFGAAQALRGLIGIPMTAAERVEYERVVAELHTCLDEKDLAAAWEQGSGLGMEQAIGLAMQEPEH